MKKIQLCALVVGALVATAASADKLSDTCKKMQSDIQEKGGASCSDEYKEASAKACTSKDDLSAVMKLYQTCLKKKMNAGKAGSGEKAATPAAGGAQTQCRAMSLDGKDELANVSDAKLTGCINALRAKMKADKCTGGATNVEFVLQAQLSATKWSKGTKTSVNCK